jgi:hypothetical protein
LIIKEKGKKDWDGRAYSDIHYIWLNRRRYSVIIKFRKRHPCFKPIKRSVLAINISLAEIRKIIDPSVWINDASNEREKYDEKYEKKHYFRQDAGIFY